MTDFWNDDSIVDGCIARRRSYFHLYANGDISPCVFAPVASGNTFDIIGGRMRVHQPARFRAPRTGIRRHSGVAGAGLQPRPSMPADRPLGGLSPDLPHGRLPPVEEHARWFTCTAKLRWP
jgi:hypothetical protein